MTIRTQRHTPRVHVAPPLPLRTASVLEEEAQVVLGELRERSGVAAHGPLEDEALLVLQPQDAW